MCVAGPASCPSRVSPTMPAGADIDGLGQRREYGVGYGGHCSAFEPSFSICCGGWGLPWAVPSGLHFMLKDWAAPFPWGDGGKGAVVHAFQWGHWASWMFDVENTSVVGRGATAAGVLDFGVGGVQGSRGGNGSDWFVEGVKELLDDAHEFHYDEASHTLHFMPNTTDGKPPPAALRLAAPALQQLMIVRGEPAHPNPGAEPSGLVPVRNLSVRGVVFRDAAPTFLEPHSVPSGGDWALSRSAALLAEGTIGLQVVGCEFERCDGNALMLSGFNWEA